MARRVKSPKSASLNLNEMNLLTKSLLTLVLGAFLGGPLIAQAAEYHDEGLVPPGKVWAAPKIECNIYFSNLLLPRSEVLSWDVTCAKGKQMQVRWTFTPEPADKGAFPLELVGFNSEEKKVTSGKTTVLVARENAGVGRNIRLLIIGDSLTASGLYTRELLRLFDGPNEPKLTLLGTQGEESNRHEGYPGWTWRRFLHPGPVNGAQSPFLFDGKLDFSEYIRTHCEGNPPEFILVFLGTNDVFGLTDANRAATISKVLADAENMLGLIRSGAENAKVGLVFPLPPASQDAFGMNYACGETRRDFFRSVKQYASEMQRRFGGREEEGIYIVPAYLGFDSEQGYPTELQPAHAHSDTRIVRQSNAVHPSVPGYRQVADVIYSWIKNML